MLQKKKSILIVIDWFFPGYKAGGPIQSTLNLCNALKGTYEIFVLTTDTDHGTNTPYPNIQPNTWLPNIVPGIKIFYCKKSSISKAYLTQQIEKVSADFIYLNHLFSPYFVILPIWLKWRNKIKSTLIICPRGALYDSALSLKKYKKLPLLFFYKAIGLDKFSIFHATNQREKNAIVQFFPNVNIVIADNLPNTNQLPFVPIEKIMGTVKCIFVARIVPIKNLGFFLKALNNCLAQIQLTIVGPVENESYWNECKNYIQQLPSNVQVNYIGAKNNTEINGLLLQHHLFVLPTTGENFGHSILEAFIAGRPVLISNQTPWLQLIEKNAGWDVGLHQPEVFTQVVEKVASYNQQQYNTIAVGAWQYAQNFIQHAQQTNQYSKLFL